MKRLIIASSLLLLAACTPSAPTNDPADGLPTGSGSGMPLLSMEDLKMQAENGNAEAMFNLGASYEEGIDVKKDDSLAREWFEKAAAKNHPEALFNLGVIYYEGLGVTQDLKKAKDYLQRSSDLGDMRAQFNLGVMIYRGEAMEQDFPLALDLFQKSAYQGMPDAAYNLAVMYVRGEGTKKSDLLALTWFKIAADLGDDKAPQAIAEASKNIPEDMVPEVEVAYQAIRQKIKDMAAAKANQ